jgi:hypothetical protein
VTSMRAVCPACKAIVLIVGTAAQCLCGAFVSVHGIHGMLPDDGPEPDGVSNAIQLRKAEVAITPTNTTIVPKTGELRFGV